MFNCKDPKLTYLNGLGYNVVRLPRAGIEPLDVIGIDGKSRESLGQISVVWSTHAQPPPIAGPQVVPNINGEKTKELDFSVGIKILASILGGMGASTPEVGWAFKNARKVEFQFTQVESYAVKPLEVGNYLQSGDLNLANDVAAHYFTSEEAEAYIITDVLKSRAILVRATDSDGQAISANLPAINEALGVTVKAEIKGSSQIQFTYQGEKQLTFGFKLFAVSYENGRWTIRGAQPSGELAFAPQDGPAPLLLKEGLLPGDFGPRQIR